MFLLLVYIFLRIIGDEFQKVPEWGIRMSGPIVNNVLLDMAANSEKH